MYNFQKDFALRFPTRLHEDVAETAYAFFQAFPAVDTILIINSCARGQAVPESDLDMGVLVRPETTGEEIARLEGLWKQEALGSAIVQAYLKTGKFAHLHLDLFKGEYFPEVWDDGGGPDDFEIGIGNSVAYAAPLHRAGPAYRALQQHWLPYYDEDLRQQRLAMVRAACVYDLDHIPFFVRRELYFQAFHRLLKAFHEFLQAVFIARRVYPLTYDKWIRMQVQDWLGLPELYAALPGLLSVSNLESSELVEKAVQLKDLLDPWTQAS